MNKDYDNYDADDLNKIKGVFKRKNKIFIRKMFRV